MKILFDTNTPAPLAQFLGRHEIVRTGDLGWQSLENGILLNAAEEKGFDVLVTCDQNISMQQNLMNRSIALVVLSTNHWPTIRPHATRAASKINFAQSGELVWIDVAAL